MQQSSSTRSNSTSTSLDTNSSTRATGAITATTAAAQCWWGTVVKRVAVKGYHASVHSVQLHHRQLLYDTAREVQISLITSVNKWSLLLLRATSVTFSPSARALPLWYTAPLPPSSCSCSGAAAAVGAASVVLASVAVSAAGSGVAASAVVSAVAVLPVLVA
eukprot:4470-Heterococcus_DN1.PRE.1